ncbi:Csa1 family protein [Macrococcoides canis]|uniref:Csa1 family protein n=1 Tax=Macrococcoides canis TaxID=1855823 RepID=UPI001AEBD1E2|nr:Csa1 family protein [Macrococcus canis]QTQ07567.1 Csa1 family protein [Macrococcus canis]
MNKYKRLLLLTWVSLIMLNIGCSNIVITKDQKVEEAFEKHLSIYPVKSLEGFYDMEGFRDEEFEKDDKGTWVLLSETSNKKDNQSPLISKGIVLFMDRNTEKARGKIFIYKYNEKKEDSKQEFPIEMNNNEIKLMNKSSSEAETIANQYRFMIQDVKINDLSKLKKIKSRHNEEMPLYTIDYQLPKEHQINKWVQLHYNMKFEDAKLLFKKTGNLNGSSTGNFQFTVEGKNKNNEYQTYSESIIYNPSQENVE